MEKKIIWASQYKKYMDILECVSSEGSQSWFKRLEHLSYREKLRELRWFSQEKRSFKRDFINVCKYWMGGCEEDSARLFLVVPSDMVRGCRHKPKYKKSHVNINFFTVGMVTHWNRLPKGLWSAHPWRYPKPNWTWSFQPTLADSALSRRLGLGNLQRCLLTSTILWLCDYLLKKHNKEWQKVC